LIASFVFSTLVDAYRYRVVGMTLGAENMSGHSICYGFAMNMENVKVLKYPRRAASAPEKLPVEAHIRESFRRILCQL
jgi:hypothetical protein